jgi:hypothetical protein
VLGVGPVRESECAAIEVDAQDGASITDDVAHEEAHVTNRATDVQHVHPGTHTGRPHHPFGQGLEQLGLLDQPFVFGVCAAERVIGGIFVEPRFAALEWAQRIPLASISCAAHPPPSTTYPRRSVRVRSRDDARGPLLVGRDW